MSRRLGEIVIALLVAQVIRWLNLGADLIDLVVTALGVFLLIELVKIGSLADKTAGAIATLKAVEGKLGPLETGLSEQVKKTDQLMGSMLEAIRIVPEFQSVTERLDMPQRSEVASLVISSFGDYTRSWREFGEHLDFVKTPQLAFAWAGLIAAHLGEEGKQLDEKKIATSSRSYTSLVTHLTRALLPVYGDASLRVTQVTAMLPHEFFNWPQAAHTNERAFPIHLARAWAGSEEYFEQLKILKDKVSLERYLLVKAGGSSGAVSGAYSLLHDFDELSSLADYWFGERLDYDAFRRMDMGELFEFSTRLAEQGIDFPSAARIGRISDLQFYPIGPRDKFAAQRPPELRLIEAFIERLHSSPKQARFCFVDGTDNSSVYNAFLADSEVLPEATIFSVRRGGGGALESSDDRQVLFALKGHLIPFTDRMLVELLGSEKRPLLEEARAALEDTSYPVTSVLDWPEGRTPAFVVEEWNRAYESETPTDWEKLPADDLRKALASMSLKEVNSVLDIGCGRGRRILDVLETLPQANTLNRADVEVVGIDFAAEAVRQAKELLVAKRGLKCGVQFLAVDLVKYSGTREEPFDLLIDWMCFHEVPPPARDEYIRSLGKLSKKYLLINVFSRAEDERRSLRKVCGAIPKYRFSEKELSALLRPIFRLQEQKYAGARVERPAEPHSDGIVAEKAAYLFKRV